MSNEENLAASVTKGNPTRARVLTEDAERAEEAQAELDKAWAKRRAEETAELTKNEAANYARGHAIIERDEQGNPIERPEE